MCDVPSERLHADTIRNAPTFLARFRNQLVPDSEEFTSMLSGCELLFETCPPKEMQMVSEFLCELLM